VFVSFQTEILKKNSRRLKPGNKSTEWRVLRSLRMMSHHSHWLRAIIRSAQPINCSVDADRTIGAVNLPNCAAQLLLWLPHALHAVIGSGLVSRQQNMRYRIVNGWNIVVSLDASGAARHQSRSDGVPSRTSVRNWIACRCPHCFDLAHIQAQSMIALIAPRKLRERCRPFGRRLFIMIGYGFESVSTNRKSPRGSAPI
jgi:hypothetical protein